MKAARSGIVVALALALLVPGSVVAQEASPSAEPAGEVADDCLTWTRHAARSLLGKDAGPAAVATMADGTFVVVGAEARLVGRALAWASDDGETWQVTRLPGGKGTGAWDVAVIGDEVYAVGTRLKPGKKPTGLVWHSADGRTWSDPLAIPGAGFSGVTGTPDGIAVVGATQRKPGQPATPTIWTSEDGRDWAPTRVGRPGSWVGPLVVSPDGTLVLAVTEAKGRKSKSTTMLHLFRSVDGVAWDDPVLAADLSKSLMTFPGGAASHGPNGFLVAPIPKGTGGDIWQSEDGAEWQRVAESPALISSFAEGPCGMLAFTNPGINTKGQFKKSEPVVLVSPDGTTWASITDKAFSRAAVRDTAMTSDGRVVAVGNSDLINGVVWVGEPDAVAEEPSSTESSSEPATE